VEAKSLQINQQTTAIIVTDPQNAFLSPSGSGYELTKDVIKEVNMIEIVIHDA
jgi:nicotinamidase-related amidase